jgi:hypothetical protein
VLFTSIIHGVSRHKNRTIVEIRHCCLSCITRLQCVIFG